MRFYHVSAQRLLLAFVVFCAMAQSGRGAIFSTEDIVNNQSRAYAANFPQVGAIYVFTGSEYIIGSGTLAVEDDIVITAAHLFDGLDGIGGGITEVRFYLGANVFSFDQAVYGQSWTSHPEYSPNGLLYGDHDLAVLHLADPIVGIAPVDIFSGELTAGTNLSMVGYGRPGTFTTAMGAFDGHKRAGTNAVSGFGEDGSSSYSTYDDGFVFARVDGPFSGQMPLEWIGSPGDSGGGWFAPDGSLAAVSSFYTGTLTPGLIVNSSAGAVNLSDYQPWLNSTIAVMTVPEPSSLLLASAGTAIVVLQAIRKRKRASL